MLKKMINLKIVGTTSIWSRWQIVIPKEVRDKLDLKPWDNMVVLMKDDKYIGLIKNDNIWDLMKYVTSEWAVIPWE
jgi:AbrB family looped-hinge helix DNA binding protein